MIEWIKQLRAEKCDLLEITARDGVKLRARYFECKPGAPVEIMFHGYQGNAERDLCGGMHRAFKLQHNVVLVDQRAGGHSDGSVITFGIKEHKDCLLWIDRVLEHCGRDTTLILTGISMGAATVMMASGADLPKNVAYIIADCGYSSARDIIKKVMTKREYPADVLYPFVRIGARVFGGFGLESTSPEKAVAKSRVPIIFFHGDADKFVPVEMSEKLYEICSCDKKLVIVKGAGHGLAYPKDPERYLAALREFDEKYIA